VAIDRESTIRRAEKLLKQGKLEAAITAYVQAVEDQPRDWNTANTLGDLFAKAGQIENAVNQYTRVAEHFAREGFFQKAAALYKKIVKIRPKDEGVLLQLAELSEQQGLLADAKSCLGTVADRRRRRGDRRGSAEIILRLAKLDPADLNAAILAARAATELGDAAGAAERYKTASSEFLRRGRTIEGLKALAEAAALNPADDQLRRALMHAYLDAGQVDRARQYAATADEAAEVAAAAEALAADRGGPDHWPRTEAVAQPTDTSSSRTPRTDRVGHKTRKTRASRQAESDEAASVESPLVRAERELRAGRYGAARAILGPLAAEGSVSRGALLALAQTLGDADADAAFACVDLASDVAVAADDFEAAASALQAFVHRVPDHVAALMKLIEISVDGGLEQTTCAAQAQLADAYLSAGRAADARVIAEDLVAREPWQQVNVNRLRRALIALREADPDRIIADHLSGASPFALTELWEEAGADGVARPELDTPNELGPGPPPESFDDIEIELDFRALAEPGVTADGDANVERVFDQWLDARPEAAAPAQELPAEPLEPAPIDEPVSESTVEPAPLLLDRSFEELLESVAPAEAETGPVIAAPLPAFDKRAADVRDDVPADEAAAGAAVLPAAALEPVPPLDVAQPVPTSEPEPPAETVEPARVFEAQDESAVTPSPMAARDGASWDWPEPAPDQDNHAEAQGDSLLTPLQVQPTWDWSEPVAVVGAPAGDDLESPPPPVPAPSLEDLVDFAPAVETPAESAAEPAMPASALPADAVAEPAPDPDLLPAPEHVDEAVPVSDELANVAIVRQPDEDLEPVIPPVEEPAPVQEEPLELTPVPAPDLEPVLEPLIASLPIVADLAESIVIVDAAPGANGGPALAEDAEPVPRDASPEATPVESLPVVAEPIVGDAEVDLSTAIGELRAGIQPAVIEDVVAEPQPAAAQADDLDRVFEMFRDEAALRGLADMGAQHLKLAAAYRDIGMVDESIGALEMAARSPRHRFEAAALLAEALRDQGRTREAVEWFERAAEAPAPGAEAGRQLLYELGKTLNDVGESERALAVFLELQADAPDYRDVAVRVRRLSSAT
jgi:tetratricopeptide (TPR) repeat protein